MKNFYLLLIPILMTWSCMKESTETQKNVSENLSNLTLTDDEAKSLLMFGNPAPLSEGAAIEAAKQFFSQNIGIGTKSETGVSSVIAIENEIVTKSDDAATGETVAYAVNFGNKEGFVVITADPLEADVAMYSESGEFDANDEFLQYMMENLKYASISKYQQNKKLNGELAEKTLEKISRHSGISTEVIKQTYSNDVYYGKAPEKTDAVTKGGMPEYYYEVVYSDWWVNDQAGPLLTTYMHRKAPYNSGIKAYGVQHNASPDAIALGQIMAYHQTPQRYTWKDTLRVFNWQQIKADYWTDTTAYNREVAVFMGAMHTMLKVMPSTPIATEVKYAVYNDIKAAFLNAGYVYGGFSRVNLHSDETGQAINSIINDVYQNRPVYMYGEGGSTTSPTKYSWVIDGYQVLRRVRWNLAFYYDYDGNKIYEPRMNTDSQQIQQYWHFNLGIDRGYLELYCKIESFVFNTPVGYDFNRVKTGIIGIRPN